MIATKNFPHVPSDFITALDKAGLYEKFTKLARSHKRDYIMLLGEAKGPEVRKEYIASVLNKIAAN